MNINDRNVELQNNKTITLNDEQYETIIKFREFLKNRNEKIFLLKGFAGTGKSTILKKIINEYRGAVGITAPTHKAKKVASMITGVQGITSQSLLGLRPDVELTDFNPNNPQFNQIALPKIGKFDLICCDESSQINTPLSNIMFNELNKHKTKLLLIGDPAQIPPVNEDSSPIFTMDFKYYGYLTKIERQMLNNPLIETHFNIRNNLNTLHGGYEKLSKLDVNGDGVYFSNNKHDFRKILKDNFTSIEYTKNIDYAKIIAWTNDTVGYSNLFIRGFLFGEGSRIVEKDDILTGYRTISSENMVYNIIENSCDYRVMSVQPLAENPYGIYGYETVLRETVESGEFSFRKVFIVDSSNHNNIHHYAELHDFLVSISKTNKSKWVDYYRFRRNNLIITDIDTHRNGTPRNKNEIIGKDIDYGYAITCHKAQGSTYNKVFIIESDINKNRKIKERNQLKYVSFTRPTNTAFVLTK